MKTIYMYSLKVVNLSIDIRNYNALFYRYSFILKVFCACVFIKWRLFGI